ncbi:MAG: hypothetical protein ACK5XB_21250 [Rhodospirillales bacterium]|jgi:hypothetical protein
MFARVNARAETAVQDRERTWSKKYVAERDISLSFAGKLRDHAAT